VTLPILKAVGARHSAGLFIAPILGDGMMPTYREGRDFVIVQPCQHYEGEYVYMIGYGGSDILQAHRARSVLGSKGTRILLYRDNQKYLDNEIGRSDFEQIVVGRIVADIKTLSESAFLDALRMSMNL
jgi:phage repressor protein C with HTH and peptisase S24 domain